MTLAVGTVIPASRMTVKQESLGIWAEILRDPNPIHLDADYVRAKGLGDAEINQGPANLAYVINALTDAFPHGRIEALDIRFIGNVFAGETVGSHGTVVAIDPTGADELVTLDVSLTAGERIVLKGGAAIRQPS